MNLSRFGEKFSADAGILSLMDDLGNALAEGNMLMMGGGNPGHIPEVQSALRQRLQAICNDENEFQKLVGIYDPPQGDKNFLQALASLFQKECGWDVGPENICLTNGSQGSFFLLFNMLAGQFSNNTSKKILFPLAPEYIGYNDLGLTDNFFTAFRPRIDLIDDTLFKYRVDFDTLTITDEIAAICVSRPTNPTGNVLTDGEIDKLLDLAKRHDIPLIIDNAYGVPFPGIIYRDATPFWNENMIVCLSLSKFGLPAARTGIVIARPETISLLSGINAIINLAPGSFGAMVACDLVRTGEIIKLSQEIIQPFYKNKMHQAMDFVFKYFKGLPYRVHVPEGAMFLWLWFPELPVTSRELYKRLRKRNVLVVAGDYFFPGIQPGWSHMNDCIRITYSQDDKDVQKGLKIIADEVKTLYHKK